MPVIALLGCILWVNSAVTELLWIAGAPLLGTTLAALFAQNAGKVVAEALVRLVGPAATQREVLVPRESGRRAPSLWPQYR